jgi:CrcB protein
MLNYLAVGVGGAIGSIGRFWLNGVISRRLGETFPLGTLVINVSGSLAIAFFATMTAPGGRVMASPTLRTFFMVGICGGYTTFSSFSLQTLNLALEGEWLYAGANTVLSVVLCLAAAWLGYVAALGIKR